MNYQWDPNKAHSNWKKHGIRFADAVSVFMDDYAIMIEDEYAHEERFVTIGRDSIGRILVVVHTYRHADVRIISARHASTHESRQYRSGL